jgi:hypothetical protein
MTAPITPPNGHGHPGEKPRRITRLRSVRRVAIAFFVIYALAVVYPVVLPFRGPRPFILGMPFAMVWAAGWIVAAFVMLLVLDRAYIAGEHALERDERSAGSAASDAESR